MATCSLCSQDVPDDEIQCCERCGTDGLGNCCIGVDDHPCTVEPSER